jgi:hypothetical protein
MEIEGQCPMCGGDVTGGHCLSCGEPTDAVIMMACPKCGEEQEDYDGFGVQHCLSCGYCAHSSITGGVCDLCERKISNKDDR